MKACFADASYYLALLNADDDAHAQALDATSQLQGSIITTEWVLAELGGRLADPRNRQAFADLVNELRQLPEVEIVSASTPLFEAGFELFTERPDKSWSLVDCMSFRVMEERGLTDALSTDHHFEQAGFHILLK